VLKLKLQGRKVQQVHFQDLVSESIIFKIVSVVGKVEFYGSQGLKNTKCIVDFFKVGWIQR